jgi:hypothetical protein
MVKKHSTLARTCFTFCQNVLLALFQVFYCFFENQLFPKVFQWATGLTLKAVIPPLIIFIYSQFKPLLQEIYKFLYYLVLTSTKWNKINKCFK